VSSDTVCWECFIHVALERLWGFRCRTRCISRRKERFHSA